MSRIAVAWLVCLSGCAVPLPHVGRDDVTADLELRSGAGISPAGISPADRAGPEWPDTVDPEDGLTNEEAIQIALWNNGTFQEVLAELGLAKADLLAAGQLSNPDISALFPVGAKQFEMAVNIPVEALWLRPGRVAAAAADARQTAQRLVQQGLQVIRDVRLACAELRLAEERQLLLREGAELRARIGASVDARIAAGDASQLEASTARIDALLAAEEAGRQRHDVALARERLRAVVGLSLSDTSVFLADATEPVDLEWSAEELVQEALATRPDLLGAKMAITAAQRRRELATREGLPFSLILPDINGQGVKGFEVGPGLQATLPLFHQNQAARAKAAAEWEIACRRYSTLRQQSASAVRTAHARYRQAIEDLRRWESDILPQIAQSVRGAETALEAGDISLALVLESSRQTINSKIRSREARAEVDRAAAELEWAVGRRLFGADVDEPSVADE